MKPAADGSKPNAESCQTTFRAATFGVRELVIHGRANSVSTALGPAERDRGCPDLSGRVRGLFSDPCHGYSVRTPEGRRPQQQACATSADGAMQSSPP